jgi:hypothetical protein
MCNVQAVCQFKRVLQNTTNQWKIQILDIFQVSFHGLIKTLIRNGRSQASLMIKLVKFFPFGVFGLEISIQPELDEPGTGS